MSATHPQRVNSHESRGNVSQTVTRFIDAFEDLAVELDAPDNVVTEFVDAGEEMAQLVEETAEQIEDNAEQIEDNAEQIEDNAEQIEDNAEQIEDNAEQIEDEIERRIGEVEGCHSRITSVEDDLDEIEVEDTNVGGRTQGSTEPQTSIERVVDLDEEIIEEELTANQQRARHVATDPRHYGEKTGRGWMLTSNDVSKVLRSGTDCDGRTQTVSRVMDFLDRLGGDEVEVTTHRGTRRVYFSEEIADRLTELATADNTVVTSQPVEGVI